MPESREEKLARIKREIAAGTYYTEAKMRRAVERMMDDEPPHDPWCACPGCVGA